MSLMNVHARLRWLLLVGVLLAPVLSACGGSAASTPIKVGSKDFTEEFIVAELYAQVLENAGFAVERKFNLGGTPVAQAAITRGDIDLYPEYTSTGLLTILKKDRIADSAQILPAVKAEYEQQFQLTWLDPSPFNDTNGLATTKAIADKYGIRTISDLAAKASELRVGGPAEFAEREDGIKGLRKTYGGFQFKEFKQLGTGPLRYDALKNGEIDIALVFTTEARIAADQLVVLQDDKTLLPDLQHRAGGSPGYAAEEPQDRRGAEQACAIADRRCDRRPERPGRYRQARVRDGRQGLPELPAC